MSKETKEKQYIIYFKKNNKIKLEIWFSFPLQRAGTTVSPIRDVGFQGWWFTVIGSVFVHSINDKQILFEKMSDAKNLCENVWFKATKKLHIY